MKLLVRWGALALSFWVATALIPGIDVKGGFTTYLWVALLFGLLNATLGITSEASNSSSGDSDSWFISCSC
jgi:hypothetical protein